MRRSRFCDALDASGNHIWSKRFGDDAHSQHGKSVATDASGSVVLTGEFRGTVNFGGELLAAPSKYDSDIFVAKFAP